MGPRHCVSSVRVAAETQGGQKLTRAFLRCGSCGAQYDPARFLDEMDEEFDQAFAGMPLDRL
jgi:hypothetical protein